MYVSCTASERTSDCIGIDIDMDIDCSASDVRMVSTGELDEARPDPSPDPSLPAASSGAAAAAAKNRVSANEKVFQAWHQRRLERHPTEPQEEDASEVEMNTAVEAVGPASVCFILQKTWNDLFLFTQQQKKIIDTKNRTKKPPAERKRNKTPFPSVLSILEADELVKQIELLAEDDDNLDDVTANSDVVRSQVLSVLPAGYDWNRAVLEMTKSRARAFLLVDLTAIVRMILSWKRLIAGALSSKKIRFLYSCQSNADKTLLQVVARSGVVGLMTTTKWDITRAASVAAVLYDNCAVTGKPDGYIREWLRHAVKQQQQSGDAARATATTTSSNNFCLAVDGPAEVERMQHSIQRMLARQKKTPDGGSSSAPVVVNVMLRLDGEPSTWYPLVLATVQKIQDDTDSRLVGISVDMATTTASETTAESSTETRQQAVEALMNAISAHATTTDRIAPALRIDLTGIGLGPFADERVQWWKKLITRPDVAQVTIDVTKALISPTGALCTRIIGVKQITSSSLSLSKQKKDDADINNGNDSDETAPVANLTSSIHQHYYIDDGCYGSLYQSGKPGEETTLCPLPLLANAASGSSIENVDNGVHLSTVWGPTCDGLDRVCRDIPLPCLRRDDWLVFPKVGCGTNEGLGTAFNGFDPPDTAYCVLGYFRNQVLGAD
jgi:hypothetical protein